MADPEILFEEKQYFGFNKYSMLRRMVLAVFCFIAYYYTENREQNADLLFLVGMSILVISIILLFVKHMHTTVYKSSIQIDGMWRTKKVKIDLSSIVLAEKTIYSPYRLNQPVYNVHVNGTIRFYTGGNDAVQLTDRDGMIYMIGTHKVEELHRIISELIKS